MKKIQEKIITKKENIQVDWIRIAIYIVIITGMLFTIYRIKLFFDGQNFEFADFKVYWRASFNYFQEGKNPYETEGYYYPPLFLVIMYPFSFLSLEQASLVWFLIEFLSIVLLAFFIKKKLEPKYSVSTIFLFLFFFHPIKSTLFFGNVTLLFCLIFFIGITGKKAYSFASSLMAFTKPIFLPLILSKDFKRNILIFTIMIVLSIMAFGTLIHFDYLSSASELTKISEFLNAKQNQKIRSVISTISIIYRITPNENVSLFIHILVLVSYTIVFMKFKNKDIISQYLILAICLMIPISFDVNYVSLLTPIFFVLKPSKYSAGGMLLMHFHVFSYYLPMSWIFNYLVPAFIGFHILVIQMIKSEIEENKNLNQPDKYANKYL